MDMSVFLSSRPIPDCITIKKIDPLKSLGYEFGIVKFTLELIKYIRESILCIPMLHKSVYEH